MAADRTDRELEEFRNVMEVPSAFDEGFNWLSLAGAVFVALLMVPGAIYMGLLAGVGIGDAARWVTVILFIEVARRAQRHLTKAEIFVLFFMAGALVSGLGLGVDGGRAVGLLWQQFYGRSDAYKAIIGASEQLPRWYAPPQDSESYHLKTFLHPDWFPVIGMVIFGTFFSQLSNMILGYGLFRLASDVEKLPFPLAPVGAQGIVAMAEDIEVRAGKTKQSSWRWRVFSIGGAIGLVFGAVYLLLPTLSGALVGIPVQIFPIPFSDFTPKTGAYLPAVATGLSWDLGNVMIGMVMPFFGMLGSFIAIISKLVFNPLMYHYNILHDWRVGDDTIMTDFKNYVDFYLSFQIGVALAIAIAGFYQVYRAYRRKKAEIQESRSNAWSNFSPPEGRGDIPGWAVVGCYFAVTAIYIGVSAGLLRWYHGTWTPVNNETGIRNVILMLLFLGFLYTPLISYVTARLEGMVGQMVEIPMIGEACMILSGYRGVACWFLPVPVANYGGMTVFYRQCELTGTKFTSIWKTNIILYPIILVSMLFFMNLIWGLYAVPSSAYPFAQRMWELWANMQSVMYSATLGEYSTFEEAFNVWYLAAGGVFGLVLFAVMFLCGAPVTLTYGVVRGLGHAMPHFIIPQFVGALIGRYYFQKRLDLNWRQYAPVVAAGYFCGVGLITTIGVGITFLSKAVIELPF